MIMQTSVLPSWPREHVDIVGELFEAGVPGVVEVILSFLTDKELCCGLAVCKKWRIIFSNHIRPVHSKPALQEQPATTLSPPPKEYSTPRHILRERHQESNRLKGASREHLATSSAHLAPRSIKLRVCPNCMSPARKLNLRRCCCTNRNCQFDFCMECFKNWHEERCIGVGNIDTPYKRSNTDIAGTKQARKRLKRL